MNKNKIDSFVLGMRLKQWCCAFGLMSGSLFALDEIPPERLPAGGWKAGIPGGIPNGYTIFCNVKESIPGTYLVAIGDGIADDAPALNAAINGAPNGTVVYIPPGNYRLNSPLIRKGRYEYDGVQHPFSIVIRGAGPSETRLLGYGASGSIIELSSGSGWTGDFPILTGNTRGSNQVTLEELSGMNVGGWIMFRRDNIEAGALNARHYMTNAASQLVRVTSITGDGPFTVEFEPALNEGYQSDRVNRWFSAPYRCGIEHLYVERMTDAGSHNISLKGAQECWIRDIVSIKPTKWNIRLASCAGCEVRECEVRDTWNGGGDSGYGVGLFQYSCSNLIENNIAERCRHSFIVEFGGQGNVFGYNYSRNPINEGQLGTDYLMGDLSLHGGSPRFNLFEGNVAATIKFDCVLGGSLNNTAFRNQIERKGLPSTYVACYAADIQKWNYNVSLIGNVYEMPPSAYNGDVYRWGTTQDNRDNIDPRSRGTAIIHGVADQQAGTVAWLPAPASQLLPPSLYLTEQPDWWDARTWPSVGPDCTPMSGGNPALGRWRAANEVRPTAPVGLRVAE